MMRKFTVFALLFPILLGLTVSVGSQTRPRRVTQPTNTSLAPSSETLAQERQRATRTQTPEIREGARRESRWPGILLNTGLAIGMGHIGHGGSCSPSRGSILNGPRFVSLSSAR